MHKKTAVITMFLISCATPQSSTQNDNLLDYLPKPVVVSPAAAVEPFGQETEARIATRLDGDRWIAEDCFIMNAVRSLERDKSEDVVPSDRIDATLLQIGRIWVARVHEFTDAANVSRPDVGRILAIKLQQAKLTAEADPKMNELGLAACDAKMRRALTEEQRLELYGS